MVPNRGLPKDHRKRPRAVGTGDHPTVACRAPCQSDVIAVAELRQQILTDALSASGPGAAGWRLFGTPDSSGSVAATTGASGADAMPVSFSPLLPTGRRGHVPNEAGIVDDLSGHDVELLGKTRSNRSGHCWPLPGQDRRHLSPALRPYSQGHSAPPKRSRRWPPL